MEPAALPAVRMINRPDGAAGKCGRKQPSGCAAATAVRNSPSRQSRAAPIKAQARAANFDLPPGPLRGGSIVVLAKWLNPPRHKHRAVIGCNPRWKAPRRVTILRVRKLQSWVRK